MSPNTEGTMSTCKGFNHLGFFVAAFRGTDQVPGVRSDCRCVICPLCCSRGLNIKGLITLYTEML